MTKIENQSNFFTGFRNLLSQNNVLHIYAIGDIVGNPLLAAHKASAEGRVAVEVITGKKHFFDPKCIPSVAYTDPDCLDGLAETQAKEQGIAGKTGVFPWITSGRALSLHHSEGFTKLIFNDKGRVIGAGIVGMSAGNLISEMALAIERGCDAEDLALTIHPHLTLSESVMMTAEVFEGTITNLYFPKKKV